MKREIRVVSRLPGYVLLGGFGALGAGQLWFEDDGVEHVALSGYAEAPVVGFSAIGSERPDLHSSTVVISLQDRVVGSGMPER